MTLFDPDAYGPGTLRRIRKPTAPARTIVLPRTGWMVLLHLKEPSLAHRVDATVDRQGRPVAYDVAHGVWRAHCKRAGPEVSDVQGPYPTCPKCAATL